MSFPVIRFNNLTGSDTQASGAGPETAVFGAAAAHTNGSSSTTITLTNDPDLSGVTPDTSVLWLRTSSTTRRFTRITAVNNTAKTVTVEDSFNIAAASAVDYAIGGKRATIDHADSIRLFIADAKAGWTIDIEETGTTYTLTQPITSSIEGNLTAGQIVIRSSSANRPLISRGAAPSGTILFDCTSVGRLRFENLRFHIQCSAEGGGVTALRLGPSGSVILCSVINCEFDLNSALTNTSATAIHFRQNNPSVCEVVGCTIYTNVTGGVARGVYLEGTGHGSQLIRHNRISGFRRGILIANQGGTVVHGNILTGNTVGVELSNAGQAAGCRFTHNTIQGSESHGILLSLTAHSVGLVVENNIICANNGFAINSSAGNGLREYSIRNNVFGSGTTGPGAANTSGTVNNLTAGPGNLNVNPDFVNASGGDYTPQNSAVIGAGHPASANLTPGAIQVAGASSGGGHPRRRARYIGV